MLENQKVRCVVTGIDSEGLSMVAKDAPSTNIFHPLPEKPECALINLWRIKSMPAGLATLEDMNKIEFPLAPSKNGVNFRYVDFPPDASYVHLLNNANVEKTWEQLKTDQTNTQPQKKPHPLMHKTKSVDFGIVLSGEIYLILDKEERLIKTGEVVIQHGTNHAWSNRSQSMCRMPFILIDAE